MPIYDYVCPNCGWEGELIVRSISRDAQLCEARIGAGGRRCLGELQRLVSAPHGRVIGRADGKVIGGPDQFTADVLGYKVKDLPAHLRADKGET